MSFDDVIRLKNQIIMHLKIRLKMVFAKTSWQILLRVSLKRDRLVLG